MRLRRWQVEAMKNVLALAYASGILFAELLFSGCLPEETTKVGLPDSARFSYEVAPELQAAFTEARLRIQRASGVELVEAEGGTPINFYYASLTKKCADTYITGWPDDGAIVEVFIDVYLPPDRCGELADTLVHELIHSLRRVEDLGNPEDTHAETGVFARLAGSPLLDTASLTRLCEAVECTTFNPEY
jgi:hypothetical protein